MVWTKREDEFLINLVNSSKYRHSGRIKWEEMAKMINKEFHATDNCIRLSKHCRERWVNTLNPKISQNKWSVEEDIALLRQYLKTPKKWSIISKAFVGRNDISVKSRLSKLLVSKEKSQTRSLYGENEINLKQQEHLNFLIKQISQMENRDQSDEEELIEINSETSFQGRKKIHTEINEINTKFHEKLQQESFEKVSEEQETNETSSSSKDMLEISKIQETPQNDVNKFILYQKQMEEINSWERFLMKIQDINIYSKKNFF